MDLGPAPTLLTGTVAGRCARDLYVRVHLPGPAVSGARQLSVLVSGGVDSAVLLADQARNGGIVHPIYVRFGLSWEPTEEAHLRQFLDALPREFETRPLVILSFPIADVYGAHWSVSG